MVLTPEPIKGRKKGEKMNLATDIMAFDIETTNIDSIKQSFIYHWQLQFGHYFTLLGRHPSEIRQAFDVIHLYLKERNASMICFVHNLSFEFQFLAGLFPLGEDRVFVIDHRKILRVQLYDNIELRCAYLQTGRSLADLTSHYNVKHQKLSGDVYNYQKFRSPLTPLTPLETLYCVNDVRGLVESMEIRKAERGDTWYSFPYTKTGYIRRRVKKALGYRIGYINKLQPDFNVYMALRRAFRGGNTHANPLFVGKIIKDVMFVDRSSSYPDVIMNCLFPQGDFKMAPVESMEGFLQEGYALLFDIRMTNVRLKDGFNPCPYLSFDKVRRTQGTVKDNGRIIESKVLETTITDIDFKIIQGQYDFDYEVLLLWYCRYDTLPQELLNIVRDLYVKKTSLKGVEGSESEYMFSKEDINSVYGMMVQDPGKPDIDFDGENYHIDDEEVEQSYNKRVRSNPLLYCWGVWVTAWARLRLQECIDLVGRRMVYCDTDSVAFVGDIDLSGYNALRIADSTHSGSYATDPNGVKHYMGVFEPDKSTTRFITFGAKKYAYEDAKGLHITIAGVHKSKGAKELELRGGLEALKVGFVFHDAGGTSARYNDEKNGLYKCPDGCIIELSRNIYIGNSTYRLGYAVEYENLLRIVPLIPLTVMPRFYEQFSYYKTESYNELKLRQEKKNEQHCIYRKSTNRRPVGCCSTPNNR